MSNTKPFQPSTRDQLERGITLIRRAKPFWKRAFVVFILGVMAAVPFVFTRPRAYKSETVILYQETIRSTDLTGNEGTGPDNARRVGARLREVLLARASLEPIITDLHLYTKPGKTLDRGELLEAVEDLRKSITFRAREGDTFEISFVGATPHDAQEVTRRLGECIIQEAAGRRSEQAKTLKDFLDQESERNKADLKQKEAALAGFVAAHPALAARLLAPPGQALAPGAGTSTGSTPMNTGDPYLNGLEYRAARIDRQLRAAANHEPPPPPKPKPVFQPPPDSAELVAARRDLADKLARYTDKHPDVIAARNRLRVAEDAQASVTKQAADAFAAQNAATQDPPPPKNATDEAALRKELADLQTQISLRRGAASAVRGDAGATAAINSATAGNPEVALEVEFRRLQRELVETQDRQHQLDEKVFKASITASSVMNDRNIQVSILDPAYLPIAPVSKPRSLMLGGLLILAFLLAVGVALTSAVLDDRIYDRVDLERIDVLPIIGVIPRAAPAQLPGKRGD